MKPGIMLKDISTSFFQRPVTERYPFEQRPAPERLRGMLQWDPSSCTGCGLCAIDCPAQAIEVIMLDKKAKRFVIHYHADRCTFCAQCVQSCRQGSLSLSSWDWELAALNREPFAIFFGSEADVQEALKETA